MNVLAGDLGGARVNVLVNGRAEARTFDSSPGLSSRTTVPGVKEISGDWTYDAVTIGYPGPVLRKMTITAFRRPVKLG